MSSKKLATFGAGCFWCVEAIFENLRGVEKVVSGYSGGHLKNPTYKQVCSGSTGHAEVCQLTYSPDTITYPELLEVFFRVHDPTTLNRYVLTCLNLPKLTINSQARTRWGNTIPIGYFLPRWGSKVTSGCIQERAWWNRCVGRPNRYRDLSCGRVLPCWGLPPRLFQQGGRFNFLLPSCHSPKGGEIQKGK